MGPRRPLMGSKLSKVWSGIAVSKTSTGSPEAARPPSRTTRETAESSSRPAMRSSSLLTGPGVVMTVGSRSL